MEKSNKLKQEIPGSKAVEAVAQTHKYVATTTRGEQLVVEKQEGSKIWDVDGNEYIDFAAGISVNNVGHRHPRVVNAVKEQLGKYMHNAPTDFYDDLQWRVAKKLTEITPGDFNKKIYFGNSGTEAVEAAIKATKKNKKGKRFLGFVPSFHGRTLGSLSFTASKTIHRKGYFPMMPGVTHVPYPYCYRCPFGQEKESCDMECVNYIENVVFRHHTPPEEVAGLLIEPIGGEGGYIIPPKKVMQRIDAITDQYDIALISDEIQAGLGRAGKMVAMEHFDVTPDVVTFAKALTNGIPLGATVMRESIAFKEKGSHSTTFGGNALALAAASEVIDILQEEQLLERSRKLGKKMKARLNELQEETKIIGDVRGLGLMIGVEIVKDKDTKEYNPETRNAIVEECFKNGVVMLPCGDSVFRIIPPLNIDEDLLFKGLDTVESVIKAAERGTI